MIKPFLTVCFALIVLFCVNVSVFAELPWQMPEDRTFVPSVENMEIYIDIKVDYYKPAKGDETKLQEWQYKKSHKVYLFFMRDYTVPYCWLYMDRHFENYGFAEGRCDLDRDGVYETDFKDPAQIQSFEKLQEGWLEN